MCLERPLLGLVEDVEVLAFFSKPSQVKPRYVMLLLGFRNPLNPQSHHLRLAAAWLSLAVYVIEAKCKRQPRGKNATAFGDRALRRRYGGGVRGQRRGGHSIHLPRTPGQGSEEPFDPRAPTWASPVSRLCTVSMTFAAASPITSHH